MSVDNWSNGPGPRFHSDSARGPAKAGACRARACPGQDNHPSLGDIVGAFKSISTIAVNRRLSRTGRRLLQEDYFEHVIRNVDSLEKIRDYILINPARWLEDPENPGRPPGTELVNEWDWLT
jgi:hypothetical protein